MMRNLSKFATAVLILSLAVAGCNKQPDNAAQSQEQQDPNYDPASANMAPADQSAPVNESASSASSANSAQPQAAPAAQPASQTETVDNDNVPPPPPDDTTAYPAD